jgi:transposase-like protein
VEELAMQKTRARSSSTYLTHRRWTVDDAKEALAAQEQSGLTLRAFATREGLEAQRLERWRRRLAEDAAPAFEEVPRPEVVADTHRGAALTARRDRFEIVLQGGRVVRVPEVFDANALLRLLEIVDPVRSC